MDIGVGSYFIKKKKIQILKKNGKKDEVLIE